MRTYFLLFLAFAATAVLCAQSQPQQASTGRLEHLADFPSQFVSARHVDVWLPDGYDGKKKFAVLYMHDGQMLYDAATTWNHQAWDVDDVAGKLMTDGQLRDFIVVGVWNAGAERHADYFPQRPFESLSATERDTVVAQLRRAGRTTAEFQPQSDAYLRFLVEELKPAIDERYAVRKGRKHTHIVGSSMGGLISMYALCEYPRVFGGAACLSTHWPGTFGLADNPMPDAFVAYLDGHLPRPGRNKLYFDCGDQTLDALYPDIQRRVDAVMRSRGYGARNWQTAYYPGTDHSEQAWNARLHVPLTFLLGK